METNINNKVWLSEEGTNKGLFLPFSKLGGSVRYNRYKIDKFIEQHEVKPTVNI